MTTEFVLSIGATLPFAALVVSAFLGAYVLGLNPRGSANRSAFLVMLAFIIWDLGEIVQRSFAPGTSSDTLFFWARVTWVGVVLVPATLYHLALTYPSRSAWFRGPWALAAVYAPFVFWAYLVTSTSLIISGMSANAFGPSARISSTYVYLAPFFGAWMFSSVLLFVRSWWRVRKTPSRSMQGVVVFGLLLGADRSAERARLRARPHRRQVPPRESGNRGPARRPRLPRCRRGFRRGRALPQTRREPGERLEGHRDRRGGPRDVHAGPSRGAPRFRRPSRRHPRGPQSFAERDGRPRPHDDQRTGRSARVASRGRTTGPFAHDRASVEGARPIWRPLRHRVGHGPSGARRPNGPAEIARHGRPTGDRELRLGPRGDRHRARRPGSARLVRRREVVAPVRQGRAGHREPPRLPALPDRRTGDDADPGTRDALPAVRRTPRGGGPQERSSFRADHSRA